MSDAEYIAQLIRGQEALRAELAAERLRGDAALDELNDTRSELAAERERVNEWHKNFRVAVEVRAKTLDERAAALANVAKLHEALEPFAAVYKEDIGSDEADEDWFRPMTEHNRAPRLTVGHLQRAYAAWFETGAGMLDKENVNMKDARNILEELRRVRAELAAEREQLSNLYKTHAALAEAMSNQVKENAKLHEALEPLAKEAERLQANKLHKASVMRPTLTAGELCRARSAIEKSRK